MIAQAHLDLVLLAVLSAVSVLLIVAYHSRVPYPILLVIGGAALGFVPGIPDVELNPDVVLIIVLPPLLYAAAFFSSLRELRDNLREISLLAIGLVIFTMVGVAVVAHELIDGMSWEAAFVLGAVVSPTDPVAASAIASRVGAPRRYVTIVEGESLVNDATALVAYKFAVAATVTGSFSMAEAGGRFVLNAVVGIAIGIAVGYVVALLRKALDDAPTEITISLVTPYFAYLPAEALGVSAVLAAVTAGIYLGWRSPELITPGHSDPGLLGVGDPRLRPQRRALHARRAPAAERHRRDQPDVDALDPRGRGRGLRRGHRHPLPVGLPRHLRAAPALAPRARARARRRTGSSRPSWRGPACAARCPWPRRWPSRRRSTAARDFPQRDLIIFLTYAVILATLILQGLTLPGLIKVLDVEDDGNLEQRESKARILAARAALDRIEELRGQDWVRDDTADRMRGMYDFRIRRFSARFDDEDDGAIDEQSYAYQRLRRKVLEAERAEIIRLRNVGKINDEIMRRLERDLDLEDTRLEV